MLFLCFFFSCSSTRSHPVCPVCSSTCHPHHLFRKPPRAPPSMAGVGAKPPARSVRRACIHGMPWFASCSQAGGQFNDMSSGATSHRYSRDVKLYAQAGGPFVLDDDDRRRHFGKFRSTVSGFSGGKPTDGPEASLLVAPSVLSGGAHIAADAPSLVQCPVSSVYDSSHARA